MVLSRAADVRRLVENGDYAKCPVKGEQDVQLFLIDGMTAILKQSRGVGFLAVLSGGTAGATIVGIIFGAIKAWNVLGGH
jgi:hypothetical protein